MNIESMLNAVKDNLGHRASGNIGSRTVDAVVLDAINLAVPHCTQEAQPDFYNRVAVLPLVVGTREYPLPIVDEDGDKIKIKRIYSHRVARAGGTEIITTQINYAEFVNRTRNYSLDYVGTPSYFALWGPNNKLHLDYFPSENYTMTLYVEVLPNLITDANLQLALPIDESWNIAVEAYATKHCFLKLQQTEMHDIWDKLYQNEKKSISRDVNEKHGENMSVGDKRGIVSDPALNPMARRWN